MRNEIVWYAVRCCCQPTEIFGFLPLSGRHSMHKIEDRYGREHKVEVKKIAQCAAFRLESAPSAQPIFDEELAIYSDDRPIEFWRTIPEFLEVVPTSR